MASCTLPSPSVLHIPLAKMGVLLFPWEVGGSMAEIVEFVSLLPLTLLSPALSSCICGMLGRPSNLKTSFQTTSF